ncbi:MAG TPA: Crp/Fnr family transcriptional regulator [Patescibacteria group bacterium]
MYEILFETLLEEVSLTRDEQDIIKTYFIPRKLKKRQFLLQAGDVCNRITFVEKGALYSYSTDEKGTQHIIQFAFEGWWIGDPYSLLTKEPSKLNIEVLEECQLLQLHKDNEQILFKKVPAFETYARIRFQHAFIFLQKRIESILGLSAEEKYNYLLKEYPVILTRVPLHLIAGFLGVTPESLSRIRNQLTQQIPGKNSSV